ncbi:CHAP domain-containing protein, partial [Acinetobacter stercoris]
YVKINQAIKNNYPEIKVSIDANNINNLYEGTLASMAYWFSFGLSKKANAKQVTLKDQLDTVGSIIDTVNPLTSTRKDRENNFKNITSKVFKLNECKNSVMEAKTEVGGELSSVLEEMKQLVDKHIPYSQEGARGAVKDKNAVSNVTDDDLVGLDCSETVSIYLLKLGVTDKFYSIHTGIMLNEKDFRKAIRSNNIEHVVGSESKDFIPEVGDIFVWRNNGAGHCGIVYAVDQEKDSVTILEAIGKSGSRDESYNIAHGGEKKKYCSRTAIYPRSGKALASHPGWKGYFRPLISGKKL